MRPSNPGMHEHDLDLIAALADGSLEDEREARSLIETCQVCREEYQVQTRVLARLDAIPREEMTELEKAGLHRDLWTELRREPARAVPVPWWQRLGYVAAGLFVIVGLVAVLNALGGGGDDAALIETMADMAATTTAEEAGELFGDDRAGGGAPADEGEAATTTTAAEASAQLAFDELVDSAREIRRSDSFKTMSLDSESEQCLARLGLGDHQVVERAHFDRSYLAMMPADPDDETVTIVAIEDCEIVHVDTGAGSPGK